MSQSVHDTFSRPELYFPGSQSEHESAPAFEYTPVKHCLQLMDSAVAYFPPSHSVHEVAPV